jgi:hypothetical protein
MRARVPLMYHANGQLGHARPRHLHICRIKRVLTFFVPQELHRCPGVHRQFLEVHGQVQPSTPTTAGGQLHLTQLLVPCRGRHQK